MLVNGLLEDRSLHTFLRQQKVAYSLQGHEHSYTTRIVIDGTTVFNNLPQ